MLNITVTEIDAHPEKFSPVVSKKSNCIMFIMNLLKSLFCDTIQFKFHHIDKTVGLKHKIHSPFTYVILRSTRKAHQFKNDKQ